MKLKQYHTEEKSRLENLGFQESNLIGEIDKFVSDAFAGNIPPEKLAFPANKVYKKQGNETEIFSGSIGQVIGKLAEVNCLLWHEQEKVYEFEKVPVQEKDNVIKRLAILNLERNNCIDKIDKGLKEAVEKIWQQPG